MKIKNNNILSAFLTTLSLSLVLSSCNEDKYFPKPLGFHRIDFPETINYNNYSNESCPFTFKHPDYAIVEQKSNCSQNIHFPKFKATIHGTYIHLGKGIKNNFEAHSEYSRELTYEHRIKADNIEEIVITNDSNKVYGIAYSLEGNTASNYQFFISDSNTHFYRGALYFQSAPNIDSIKPVLNHIKSDISNIIESFSWK